jgi:hypothetical protein
MRCAAWPGAGSKVNFGWYRIPLLRLLALVWGAETSRLLRRYEPVHALLWLGLFLLTGLALPARPRRLLSSGPGAVLVALTRVAFAVVGWYWGNLYPPRLVDGPCLDGTPDP